MSSPVTQVLKENPMTLVPPPTEEGLSLMLSGITAKEEPFRKKPSEEEGFCWAEARSWKRWRNAFVV